MKVPTESLLPETQKYVYSTHAAQLKTFTLSMCLISLGQHPTNFYMKQSRKYKGL